MFHTRRSGGLVHVVMNGNMRLGTGLKKERAAVFAVNKALVIERDF